MSASPSPEIERLRTMEASDTAAAGDGIEGGPMFRDGDEKPVLTRGWELGPTA